MYNTLSFISELRIITCHMGSHGIICYPTQVNAPHFNHSQTSWSLLDTPPSQCRDSGITYFLIPDLGTHF